MFVSIKPGIYIEGVEGFPHSDIVLVTEDGCLSLTDYPDRMDGLILKLT